MTVPTSSTFNANSNLALFLTPDSLFVLYRV